MLSMKDRVQHCAELKLACDHHNSRTSKFLLLIKEKVAKKKSTEVANQFCFKNEYCFFI